VIKRWIVFIAGMNFLAIGIILNTKSMLGVGSINTIPYALSNILNISLGTVTMIVYSVFIILQFILIKKIDMQIIMQLPYSFLFGILLDFYDVFFNIIPHTLMTQFLLLSLAIILTALGAFMMILANIVLNPADGIVHTISEVYQKEFGTIKNIFDITAILLTTILCLISKGYIIGIGIGTILSAIFIGRCIALYQRSYNLHIAKKCI
jgi:uncharacterized membrane protein YczE